MPYKVTLLDYAVVLEAIASNDDLGVVLRTHLEMERSAVRLLERKFPNYKALNHNGFAQHLRALRALGMDGALLQVFDQVNKVRNEMAHVKKGAKTKLHADDLVQLYSQAAGVLKYDFSEFMVALGQEPYRPMKELTFAHQFCLIGFMCAALLDIVE